MIIFAPRFGDELAYSFLKVCDLLTSLNEIWINELAAVMISSYLIEIITNASLLRI